MIVFKVIILILLSLLLSLYCNAERMLLKDNIISNNNNNNNKTKNQYNNNDIENQNRLRIVLHVLEKAKIEALKGGISGAAAGCIQVITLMWLRTTVNYQYKYGVSTTIAIIELYKQGGIFRFYRGLPYAILQGPLARFGSVAANEGARVIASYYIKDSKASLIAATSLGSILAAIWRIFLMPLDTFKTILQVEGSEGFQKLIHRLSIGDIGVLYHGTLATILVTIAGYYPWFFVHNYLDAIIGYSKRNWVNHTRSALIGFLASAVSDTLSNFIRVVKTVKQSSIAENGDSSTYYDIINQIYNEGGLMALFGRGLITRILTNGLQSMLFTVMWKIFANRDKTNETKYDEKRKNRDNIDKIV